jgi:hypothetical protein
MHMLGIACLNEKDAPLEMIHHFLKTPVIPPLDREIPLSTRDNQPKGHERAGNFLDLGNPSPFFPPEKNVSPEERRLNVQAERLAEAIRESVDEMKRPPIAVVDERISAIDQFDLRILFGKGRHSRIVFPERAARGPHVRQESAWISDVQIPDRRREHHDITGRLPVSQDELFHRLRLDSGLPNGVTRCVLAGSPSIASAFCGRPPKLPGFHRRPSLWILHYKRSELRD